MAERAFCCRLRASFDDERDARRDERARCCYAPVSVDYIDDIATSIQRIRVKSVTRRCCALRYEEQRY